MSSPLPEEAYVKFKKIDVESAERHVFVCLGPDCCKREAGERVWKHLKELLKEHRVPVLRTKAECLRVCAGGPWMLVYPEGTWYGNVDRERCERIVEEHLLGGRPIAEWAAKVHPLGGAEPRKMRKMEQG